MPALLIHRPRAAPPTHAPLKPPEFIPAYVKKALELKK